jgi:hypothetical protein
VTSKLYSSLLPTLRVHFAQRINQFTVVQVAHALLYHLLEYLLGCMPDF